VASRVWTYSFYDGWVPNYMIFIAHSHNHRPVHEVQGQSRQLRRLMLFVLNKEWYGPIRPAGHQVGPRSNTNIRQSAVLFSLSHGEEPAPTGNYWLKNKRSIEKGKSGPVHAWVFRPGSAEVRYSGGRERPEASGTGNLAGQRAVKAGGLSEGGRLPGTAVRPSRRCISRFKTIRLRILHGDTEVDLSADARSPDRSRDRQAVLDRRMTS
jgi:hypothetical protein